MLDETSPDIFAGMNLTRRKLFVVGGGLVAAACGGVGTQTLGASIAAGNAKDLTSGTLRPITGQGVAIGRDTGGIYAISVICTHQGCDISVSGTVSAGGVDCACHGSVFDAQGNVLRGPAISPLPHLVVTEDATGTLTIHGDQTTSASTRIPG